MRLFSLLLALCVLVCGCEKQQSVKLDKVAQPPVVLSLIVKFDPSTGEGDCVLAGKPFLKIAGDKDASALPGSVLIKENISFVYEESDSNWCISFMGARVSGLKSGLVDKEDAVAFVLKHRVWQIVSAIKGCSFSEDLIYLKLIESLRALKAERALKLDRPTSSKNARQP